MLLFLNKFDKNQEFRNHTFDRFRFRAQHGQFSIPTDFALNWLVPGQMK